MKTQSFKLQNVELRRHELRGTFEIRNRGKNANWELQKLELRETHENMNLDPWKLVGI
jgi:hypothetical protein